MNHIVDVEIDPRPGLVEVLKAATAEVNAAAAAETEPSETVDEHSGATVVRAAANFAPPTDPERMATIAARTDEFVRAAYKEAGKALMAMCDDAQKELDAARLDVVGFVADLEGIGGVHAERLQGVFAHVQGILTRVQEERKQSAALLPAKVDKAA